MNRRTFFQLAAGLGTAAPLLATGYALAEATHLKVDQQRIGIPNLPTAFQGRTVAFLTDLHHGPNVELDYLAGVVRATQQLAPDVILLGGDYISEDPKYIGPVFDLLKCLSAPLGVYGVLGNHDHRYGAPAVRQAMKTAGIIELTNRGTRLTRRGESLWLGGVDDLWYGRVDVPAALTGQRDGEASLLLCHNPDVVETLREPRVGLVLSGHTHGGQLVIPGFGSWIVPSRYGQKYAHGLVEGPSNRVYVSAGVGTSVLPVRTNCRPEITLIELV